MPKLNKTNLDKLQKPLSYQDVDTSALDNLKSTLKDHNDFIVQLIDCLKNNQLYKLSQQASKTLNQIQSNSDEVEHFVGFYQLIIDIYNSKNDSETDDDYKQEALDYFQKLVNEQLQISSAYEEKYNCLKIPYKLLKSFFDTDYDHKAFTEICDLAYNLTITWMELAEEEDSPINKKTLDTTIDNIFKENNQTLDQIYNLLKSNFDNCILHALNILKNNFGKSSPFAEENNDFINQLIDCLVNNKLDTIEKYQFLQKASDYLNDIAQEKTLFSHFVKFYTIVININNLPTGNNLTDTQKEKLLRHVLDELEYIQTEDDILYVAQCYTLIIDFYKLPTDNISLSQKKAYNCFQELVDEHFDTMFDLLSDTELNKNAQPFSEKYNHLEKPYKLLKSAKSDEDYESFIKICDLANEWKKWGEEREEEENEETISSFELFIINKLLLDSPLDERHDHFDTVFVLLNNNASQPFQDVFQSYKEQKDSYYSSEINAEVTSIIEHIIQSPSIEDNKISSVLKSIRADATNNLKTTFEQLRINATLSREEQYRYIKETADVVKRMDTMALNLFSLQSNYKYSFNFNRRRAIKDINQAVISLYACIIKNNVEDNKQQFEAFKAKINAIKMNVAKSHESNISQAILGMFGMRTQSRLAMKLDEELELAKFNKREYKS